MLDSNEFTFYIDEVEVSIRAATYMFILLTGIRFGYATLVDKYTLTISSLYLYKVLEHFFLIVKKDEFEIEINDYNKDKAIDILIKKLQNYIKTRKQCS